MIKKTADIDIDFADRNAALQLFDYTQASQLVHGTLEKHNVGVYLHDVPIDPITGCCSLPYNKAEELGFFKIDFLNIYVYQNVKDEEHLLKLMNTEPIWELLEDKEFVNDLFQINGHFDVVSRLKPKSIDELAMVIALIRPGKKHLINQGWDKIKKHIWTKNPDDDYVFKRSHAISYSMAIVVQMNLKVEEALVDEQKPC
jgi:Bacterial DNA polymerase III alpha subunit finger domain